MAETLTAKLLRAHTPGDSQGMDDEVRLRVDQVLLEDYTGTMACLQFEQVGVDLRGRLTPWVQAKDIVLELLRRRSVRGGVGRIFEFFGEGVPTLSATQRGTICNMVMETGATTGLFPSDERTREWLAEQQRADQWVALAADPGGAYDEVEVIDLEALE